MTIQHSGGYLILKYSIVISIAITLIHCAVKILSRLIVKKFVNEQLTNPEKSETSQSIEEEIIHQLAEVQKLAQKISDEKEVLQSNHLDIFSNEHLLDTHKEFASLQDQLKTRFEEYEDENKARFESVQNTIETLINEISSLKEQTEHVTKVLKSPELANPKEKSPKICRRLAENASQTEESYKIITSEDFDCELSEEDWRLLKGCLSTANAESERLWIDRILKFFQKLEKEYESIKNVLSASWEDIIGEIANCGSILDKVQNVEQTVFGILIFLQQRSVDAQTVRETLRFFDHKFQKFYQRSDSKWKKSHGNLDAAFKSVQKAQTVLSVSSLAFNDASIGVARKLDSLNKLVMEFGFVTKLLNDAEHFSCAVERSVCELVNNVADVSSKLDNVYCQRIGKLSKQLLEPGENLYVLYKTTQDLQNFTKSLNFPFKTQTSKNSLDPNDKIILASVKELPAPLKSTNKLLNKIDIHTNASFEDALKEIQKTCAENEALQGPEDDSSEKHSKTALDDLKSDCLMKSTSSLESGENCRTG